VIRVIAGTITSHDTFRSFPPHCVSEVLVAGAMDADVTGSFAIWYEDGSATYTPAGFPYPKWLCANQDNDVCHGKDWIPCTSGTLRFKFAYAGTDPEQTDVRVNGYRDRFLTGRV
jgi:hypothetical protein